jgi:hypothetical protein
MQLLRELIRDIPPEAVEDVVIGVHAVLVKSAERAGIASTLKYCGSGENVRRAGELEELDLRTLAEYALSDNLLEASAGMAAVNCYYAPAPGKGRPVNAKDLILEKGKGKSVGIIGHFPFLDTQKAAYAKYRIFEKKPRAGDLKEKDIPEYLPDAEVVAVTATAFTNHSFEAIMRCVTPGAYVIVLGPSTPLSGIMFRHGVDALSGTRVRDYARVRKCVLQACPTRHVRGVDMITLFREET